MKTEYEKKDETVVGYLSINGECLVRDIEGSEAGGQVKPDHKSSQMPLPFLRGLSVRDKDEEERCRVTFHCLKTPPHPCPQS